jgi:hypothetical protein
MQDRFACDIGDYGKFSLLKALVGNELRLGVVWYLNPRDAEVGGGHVGYLCDPDQYQRFDPSVYDVLRRLNTDGERNLRAMQREAGRDGNVLPRTTLFYEKPVLSPEWEELKGAQLRGRLCEWRIEWHAGAVRAMRDAQVVFLDPDNGLMDASPRHGRPFRRYRETIGGAAYAFLDELHPYCCRGQSLVVYHHLGRHIPVREQVRRWLERLHRTLGGSRPTALVLKRFGYRAYFIIPAARNRRTIHEAVKHVVDEWRPWVDLVGLGVD